MTHIHIPKLDLTPHRNRIPRFLLELNNGDRTIHVYMVHCGEVCEEQASLSMEETTIESFSYSAKDILLYVHEWEGNIKNVIAYDPLIPNHLIQLSGSPDEVKIPREDMAFSKKTPDFIFDKYKDIPGLPPIKDRKDKQEMPNKTEKDESSKDFARWVLLNFTDEMISNEGIEHYHISELIDRARISLGEKLDHKIGERKWS